MNAEVLNVVANSIYVVMAIVALWGAYCVIMVWSRVKAKSFRSEAHQRAFLDAISEPMSQGQYEDVANVCGRDPRALVQMVRLAIDNKDLGYTKVKALLLDRFERDVLADLDYRVTWVKTVIATAPMLGLLGTVLGMMGAFEKLASSSTVEPTELAGDISFALITTALGLIIAIPLVVSTASLNNRIKQLEDLISVGFSEFLDVFRNTVGRN